MKSKLIPQPRMQKIIPWLPVLLALTVTLISLALRTYTNRLDLTSPSVTYLAGTVNFDLLAFIAIAINVLVIAFYIRAIANLEPGSFAKLGLTALLFFVSAGSFGHAITHKNSLGIDQNVYHLVVEKDSGEGVAVHSSYVVLECDSSGVSCHFYAKPFTTHAHCFQDKATLEQDAATAQLVLIWERYDEDIMNMPFSAGDTSPLVACDEEE